MEKGINGYDKQGTREGAPLKDTTAHSKDPGHEPPYASVPLISLIKRMEGVQNAFGNLEFLRTA